MRSWDGANSTISGSSIIRNAKSASYWTQDDLAAYTISVVSRSAFLDMTFSRYQTTILSSDPTWRSAIPLPTASLAHMWIHVAYRSISISQWAFCMRCQWVMRRSMAQEGLCVLVWIFYCLSAERRDMLRPTLASSTRTRTVKLFFLLRNTRDIKSQDQVTWYLNSSASSLRPLQPFNRTIIPDRNMDYQFLTAKLCLE